MKKSIIEKSSIELLELFDMISKEAKKEKSATIVLNRMMHWWTRKPLIVGRAVALASTLDDTNSVKDLLGIYGDKRAYLHTPNTDLYEKRLGGSPSAIKVLDPFAGAGNLAFPLIELGLDVTCADYNPLAYLIKKSTLEIRGKKNYEGCQNLEKINRRLDSRERITHTHTHTYTHTHTTTFQIVLKVLPIA